MTLVKGVEKVVGAEGFDFSLLKEVVKKLNEAGILAKAIKVVAVGKEKLVDDFIKGIEGIPEGGEEEKKIPVEVIKFYNDYVDILGDKKMSLEGGASAGGAVEKKGVGEKSKTKEPVVKKHKKNRAEIFVEIMKAGGGTKEKIISLMQEQYGGSEKEAEFQTLTFLRLLKAFEFVSANDAGIFTLSQG